MPANWLRHSIANIRGTYLTFNACLQTKASTTLSFRLFSPAFSAIIELSQGSVPGPIEEQNDHPHHDETYVVGGSSPLPRKASIRANGDENQGSTLGRIDI